VTGEWVTVPKWTPPEVAVAAEAASTLNTAGRIEKHDICAESHRIPLHLSEQKWESVRWSAEVMPMVGGKRA
jgi:hypothetical protein